MKRLATLALLAACGGSDSEGVTWRLPCGAAAFLDGVPSNVYTFEHDELGNVTTQIESTADNPTGAISSIHAEYDGYVATRYDFDSAFGVSYVIDAIVEDGRVLSRTKTNRRDADFGHHETWTWNGEDLQRIERTFDAYYVPELETFEATATGFTRTLCVEGSACHVDHVTGADHVGDYRHWTRLERDDSADGSIGARFEQTFESHGLVLTADTYYESEGELVLAEHTDYEREPDGTLLREVRQYTAPAATLTTEYTFDCD